MGSLGTEITVKEGLKTGSKLEIGGKLVPVSYNRSIYVVELIHIGEILGNKDISVHMSLIPKNVTVKLHEEDQNRSLEDLNKEISEVLNVEVEELSNEEKTLIWKVHKFYGHRHRDKVAKMLQYLPRFKGKLSKIKEELESCQVCNQRIRASPRPKVGLPRAVEVNQVVSLDLKIIPQNDQMKRKYAAILYMQDEFTKIIKARQ